MKIGIRLLEFIGCTRDHRLSLIPDLTSERRVMIYTDASFAPYGGFSVSGILILYLGRVVMWKAKRQSMITLSTAESELLSAVEGDSTRPEYPGTAGHPSVIIGVNVAEG